MAWRRQTLPDAAPSYAVMLTILVLWMGGTTAAFLQSHSEGRLFKWGPMEQSSTAAPLHLSADDIFDGFKKFWNQGDNGEDNEKDRTNQNKSWPNVENSERQDDGNDDDEWAAGTTLLLSIPVKQMKPGGLRLFLMFYLLGMQNTPDRNSWRANQPSTDEYVLEMLFQKDSSALIQLELLEDEIRILRCGSVPSTAYLMQESVIVDGILNELHQCAFGDDSIPEHHRLLIPEPLNAIDAAREALAFG